MHSLTTGRRRLLQRGITVLCAAILSPAVAVRAVATDGFLSRLEDLPLVPGLSEDIRAGVSFDTAAGRIVEAFARGNLTERQVLDFYRETLPQLGWTAESPTEYRRGGERLRIALTSDAQGLVVRYSLSPQ
jgi:hypothetical protein